MNADGTIGPQAVQSALVEDGWTNIRQYTVGLNNFLIYANANSAAMRIRRIDLDGSEGEPIQTWAERAGPPSSRTRPAGRTTC